MYRRPALLLIPHGRWRHLSIIFVTFFSPLSLSPRPSPSSAPISQISDITCFHHQVAQPSSSPSLTNLGTRDQSIVKGRPSNWSHSRLRLLLHRGRFLPGGTSESSEVDTLCVPTNGPEVEHVEPLTRMGRYRAVLARIGRLLRRITRVGRYKSVCP